MRRYFSLQEAEALLPLVSEKMQAIRDMKRQVDGKIAQWEASGEDKAAEPAIVDEAVLKAQVNFIVAQINGELETLQKLGCLPKDLELGLVDFPTRMDEQEGFLCWRLGERRIEFWHGMTEGFRGRKPIVRTAVH